MPSQKAKKICKESKMTKAEIKILIQEYILSHYGILYHINTQNLKKLKGPSILRNKTYIFQFIKKKGRKKL